MNSNGLKVPKKWKDPIDYCCIELVDLVHPIFRKLNFTPNMLTMLGMISRISSFKFLFGQQKNYFVLFQLIGYFFDVIDGHYARIYKMTSQFGDILDHLNDNINVLGFIYYLYNSKSFCKSPYKWVLIGVFMIIFSCMVSYQGCQEKIHDDGEVNQILGMFRSFCPDTRMIEFTKYFGPGVTLFYVIAIVYLF